METVPPLFLAGLRQTLAGLVLCVPFFWKRNWPDRRSIKISVISGIMMIVVGNGLVTWAEKYITSGLAAILCSLTPFWIVGINRFFGNEARISGKVFLGMCFGLLGVLLIFYDSLKEFANPIYLLGILGIIAANAGWGAGTVYIKKQKSTLNPLYAAGLQLFTAGLILSFLSFSFEKNQTLHFETEALISLLYLIIFGSVVAFGAYLYALAHLPSHIVSMYAYINPVVAVVLGWLLLDEKINTWISLAFILIMASVYLVNRQQKKERLGTTE